MWCLVSLPNSLVLEVELDAKALGQDCLNKVCQHMGIVETDFFGLLQVQPGPKGESPYWLNLRNGLLRQLSGSPPYRLQMKVKFFVKPHYMLHPSTRKVVLESLMSHVMDESLKCSEEELVTFLGLVAQAELGDFKQAMLPAFKESYSQYLPESKCEGEDLTVKICLEHKKHRGMKTDSAVYRALQSAVEWPGYGVEWHSVRKAQTAEPLSVGVGPEAIVLTDQQNGDKRSIEYGSVQKATHAGKCFYLHTFAEDGSTVTETFKLATQKASNALYRCVTEMYLFYYCDTVRNDVASQFDRDIKAALASLFSENKEVGKKYVFDIQQTLQETYDHNRRRLFNEENMPPAEPSEEYHSETEDDESSSDGETSNSSDEYADEVRTISSHVKPVKNGGMYSDWLLCKVCMDRSINTVFCPCGHVVCCHDCASKLQDCPLCRQVVSNVQLIYLPSVSDTKLKGVCES